MSKVALITGVTGQDGSYLAELLLEKGYEVHGIKRRASSFNTERVDHIYQDPHAANPKFHLHYGDLTDTSNLTRILQEVQPDEVYNLGAMSHVAVSFESPEYTADVDAMGTLRLLEAIRFLGLEKKTRFYQASTSELYGLVQEIPQNTQQSVCEEKKMDWTKLSPLLSKNPLEEMKRRNREMKKVRSFIRKRVAKNEFESYYLKHYEEIAWQAEKVTEQIERSGCQNLYERSIRERKMLHGDYNYHNVMILPENEVITNFERMRIGIQVDDLYYLLRKVMEKYHWKQKTGQNILEAYESVRQLKPDEREYLCLRLAYPEKFWKTASAYSRSNKAWLPEKSVEKLQTAVEQTKEKEVFLREVFE